MFLVISLVRPNQHFHLEFKKNEKFLVFHQRLRSTAFVETMIQIVYNLQSGESLNNNIAVTC